MGPGIAMMAATNFGSTASTAKTAPTHIPTERAVMPVSSATAMLFP